MGRRQKLGNPSIAVAYMRASKDEQKLSPEAQCATIESWATRERVQVAAWHLDQGVRSITPINDRPALRAALSGLREHNAGVLLVAKRDRIARDVVLVGLILREVTKSGAKIVSASGEGNGDQPADAMMRGVVDVFAAYERDMIKSRTKEALQSKKAKGERISGPVPYGFMLAPDGMHPADRQGRVRCAPDCAGCLHLVPCDSEQETIAQAGKLYDPKKTTLAAVAAELAREGKLSRAGRVFLPGQVLRMIVRRT